MRFSTLPIIVAMLLSACAVSAQNKVTRCGNEEVLRRYEQSHPGYQQAVANTFSNAKAYAEQALKTGAYTFDTIYHIPVVVHIVYKTAAQNIPDSLVYNQIEVLNRDYRRLNADTTKTRDFFKQFAGDARIEFYLATTDPGNNPTTGITRTQTTKAYFDPFSNGLGIDSVKYDAFGGIDAWNVAQYLNIWVCNTVNPSNIFGVVLGISYPPATAPNWSAGSVPADSNVQGVVIHYPAFGRNNPAATGQLANADMGRTVVHEVGHYLGLRHIWGDGANPFTGTNNCTGNDSIDDTPNASADAGNACDTTKNTCNDSLTMGTNYPDMIENYMDYADEHCQNMFTNGQIRLMRSMLATARTSLASKTIDTTGTPDVSGIMNTIADVAQIRMYPNPASSTVNIVVDKLEQHGELTIMNIFGQQIGNPIMLEAGGNNMEVSLANLAKGVYLVRVNSVGKSTTRKLIVE